MLIDKFFHDRIQRNADRRG